MNAEQIVDALLGEAEVGPNHFEVREHPELYAPTGKLSPDGRDVVNVCGWCEAEYGSDKQYPADISTSHGMCKRHLVDQLMSAVGFTREQADAKAAERPESTPDWSKTLGPVKGENAVEPGPKATFWATSGSGR